MRLRALEEAAYAFGSTLADWQGDGDTEERWRARLTDVSTNLIAWLHDVSVGQVSGTTTGIDRRVELISMWVDPRARGKGVGDALVGAVEDWARRQAAESVVLWVKNDNTSAMALYRRHGFVLTATPTYDGEREMVNVLA